MSRQYTSAARIVGKVLAGESLRKVCGATIVLGKTDYAIATQTLKYHSVIREICEDCGLSAALLDVEESMFLVLTYEMLFGAGRIDGGGVVKRRLMEYKEQLLKSLALHMKDKKLHEELLPTEMQLATGMPKYVRINEIRWSIDDGLQYLREKFPEAYLDTFVPSLVQLPANSSSMGEDPFVKNGNLIIQDKSSCFPSQILMDSWEGGDIIDACAAPGNKTSHLAALVAKKTVTNATVLTENVLEGNKVFAFDKSHDRFQLLKRRMREAGADAVVDVINQDFLSIDVNSTKYRDVRSILLDPSCSGSGLVNSWERVCESLCKKQTDEVEIIVDRLKNLQSFQLQALQKAMSFPSVQKIVYSTCSLHSEENEQVVANALNWSHRSGKGWKVMAPKGWISWKRRGMSISDSTGLPSSNSSIPTLSAQELKCLIRCFPEDGTNGFFVAMFTRDIALPISQGTDLVELQSHITQEVGLEVSTTVSKLTAAKKRLKKKDPPTSIFKRSGFRVQKRAKRA